MGISWPEREAPQGGNSDRLKAFGFFAFWPTCHHRERSGSGFTPFGKKHLLGVLLSRFSSQGSFCVKPDSPCLG
jgi:hypothetical protein